jgi:hypothetical protein
VDEIGYQLMNLGFNSQDLRDVVMTRIDLVKNMGSRFKANPKLGVKLL